MKNRDICFRAWDTFNNRMVYYPFHFRKMQDGDKLIGDSRYDAPFVYYEDSTDFEDGISRPCFIMQFSGLKDKKDKDIYEGDIIELINSSGETIRVICKFGTVVRKLDTGFFCDITSFYFENDGRATFPIISNYAGKHDLELFEVIGNIYTNTDLI